MNKTSLIGMAYADSEVETLARLRPGEEHQFVKGGMVCRRVDDRTVQILSAPGIRPSRIVDTIDVDRLVIEGM